MKDIFILLFLCFFVEKALGQKPAIDTTVYGKWPSVGAPTISKNGNYASYLIDNEPIGKHTLYIASTDGEFKKAWIDGLMCGFTQDNRKVLIKQNEKFILFDLHTRQSEIIANAVSARLTGHPTYEKLICQFGGNDRKLVVRDLKKGTQEQYSEVDGYTLSKGGQYLVFHVDKKKVSRMHELHWINLQTGEGRLIYDSGETLNIVFNNGNSGLAFITPENNKPNAIWYYQFGARIATKIASEASFSNYPGLELSTVGSFSENDEILLLKLKEKAQNKDQIKSTSPLLTLWSYSDNKLQSMQKASVKDNVNGMSYVFSLRLRDSRINRLQQLGERITVSGNYALINKYNSDFSYYEANWNKAFQLVGTDLVYLNTSDSQHLDSSQRFQYNLSQSGNYLLVTDRKTKTAFIRNNKTGVQHLLIKDSAIRCELHYQLNDSPSPPEMLNGCRWLDHDRILLIYGENDVWQIDPTCKKRAFNLTNGYGDRNHLRFEINDQSDQSIVGSSGEIILNAFNRDTKVNGYFKKELNKLGDPKKLIIDGEHLYYTWLDKTNKLLPTTPLIRSTDGNTYLLTRCSASDPVNLFATKDFKILVPLTDVHPQRGYNWLTTELINFETLDHKFSQGILYKPENFDPQKKYPVIFYYYEKMSDNLNLFQEPALATGDMNIPTMVSNGYLVFTPDILYTFGKALQSSYNSVVAAAEVLSKLPYIDNQHMGLQGHSFGAFETNYIISHTKLFTAACSASGGVDEISQYGRIRNGHSTQSAYEQGGQHRMNATLWDAKRNFIEESAIFDANQIQTPLLLMHGGKDNAVDFENAIQFFTALRRLNKKAWLLEYDNEDHNLSNTAAIDYTIRMIQFFDHYLKSAPTPKWMVEGIPYAKRGIDDGLSLEPPSIVPGPGIAIDQKQ
jgi:dienelactone hydrolase